MTSPSKPVSARPMATPRYPRLTPRQRRILRGVACRQVLALALLPAAFLATYRRQIAGGAALAIGFMLTIMLVILVALRVAYGLWLWEVL